MKKAASGTRKRSSPARGTAKNIDDYLARVPEPARTTLGRIRAAIRSAVPRQATETISYRIPAFEYKGILVWFAAFPDHCSFFPTSSGIKRFAEELKGYSTSRGTLRFPIDKPPPLGLIKRMVRARVAENEGKARR